MYERFFNNLNINSNNVQDPSPNTGTITKEKAFMLFSKLDWPSYRGKFEKFEVLTFAIARLTSKTANATIKFSNERRNSTLTIVS